VSAAVQNQAPADGGDGLPRYALWAALLLFAAVCVQVFLFFLPGGLWEDGYFFIRYARNTWTNGTMAWNPADGPVHGMTSQLYQLLITLLYPLAPHHVVTVCKLVSAASLAGAAACLFRLRRGPEDGAPALALSFVALSLPLVINHMTTGMETLVVFAILGLWALDYVAFREGRSAPWRMALYAVVIYLVRPDAVLMPLVALLPCLREQPRRAVKAYAMALGGLVACLVAFKLYYGTALPLSFYVKSYLATVHDSEHVAIFFREKIKNASQFLYFFAPFLFVAVAGRNRVGLALLVAALAFCGYHAVFTVETMGHYSRFYMPAVVPIAAAAILSWSRFRSSTPAWLTIGVVAVWAASYAFLKDLDRSSRIAVFIRPGFEVPYVVALSLALLPIRRLERILAAGAIAVAAAGAFYNYRVNRAPLMDDAAILLRQIKPRKVFLGIVPLLQLDPRHVYHTDMGAPGLLFPDAKVTDLDGLLNEEITIERRSFEELCQRDRPEAIFLPNKAYASLRAEVLRSRCFRDYQGVMRRDGSALHIRKDLVPRYEQAAAARAR
jgi:hypothetical protein